MEHFGDPLGAKVAQEPQQDLKNSAIIGFWGRLGDPKCKKNQYKVLFENGRNSIMISKRFFYGFGEGLGSKNISKLRGLGIVFRARC